MSIQYLRALAALMVVFHHARDQLPSLAIYFPTAVGGAGVDVFFIISGFVMTYTAGLKHPTRRDFLTRRAIRIVPLYWLLTLFTAVLLIAAPQFTRTSHFSLGSLVRSLLFLPVLNPGQPGEYSPMLQLAGR